MWEHLLVGAIVVLFWPLGSIACGLVCFGMGIANIPGFLIWKSRLTPLGLQEDSGDGHGGEDRGPHAPGLAGRFGLFLGWLGQMVVSMAFCAVLIAFVRWLPTMLHIANLLIWALWAMAFLTAVRPPFALVRLSGNPDAADPVGAVFADATSVFTLAGTGVGFIALALIM